VRCGPLHELRVQQRHPPQVHPELQRTAVRQYGSAHRNRPECTRERESACMCACPASRACVGLRASESAPSRVIQSMHIYIGRRRNREDGEAACPAAQSRPTCTVPPPERHSQRRFDGARMLGCVRNRTRTAPAAAHASAAERCVVQRPAWPASRSASGADMSRVAEPLAQQREVPDDEDALLRSERLQPARGPQGAQRSARTLALVCGRTRACLARRRTRAPMCKADSAPRGRCTARALARTKARPCPAKGALGRLGASVPEIHPRLGRCARRAPAPARAHVPHATLTRHAVQCAHRGTLWSALLIAARNRASLKLASTISTCVPRGTVRLNGDACAHACTKQRSSG
jgi:hypothetical protein